MPVNVNDKIKRLSPALRKQVELQAAELIAEEAAPGTQAHTGSRGQSARHHARQRLTPRKTERPAAVLASKDGSSNGWESLPGCRVS